MKTDRGEKVCVCTYTLERGLDIGSLTMLYRVFILSRA